MPEATISPTDFAQSVTTPDEETRQTETTQVYQDGTLVLVGCGKAKRDPTDPTDLHVTAVDDGEPVNDLSHARTGPLWRAEDLYTATYFRTKREFAETVTRWDGNSDTTPWAILSAEHRVLFPWELVGPYDTRIDDLGDDPEVSDHRVANSFLRRRPDGQEIVTEMDRWAAGVAYGLAKWLAMFRDASADPAFTSDAKTLLVLAGQDYIEPLRERGVFEYGISRMAGDVNEIYELPVHVRFLFEEIDAGGNGEQMAWLSDVIETLDDRPAATEQQELAAGGGRDE